MPYLRLISTIGLVAAILSPSALSQKSLTLTADKLEFDEGDSSMTFDQESEGSPTTQAERNLLDFSKMRTCTTTDGLYLIFADPPATSPATSDVDTNYHLYSRPIGQPQEVSKYTLAGSPHGNFTDHIGSVTLHLNKTHTCSLRLPLHSFANKEPIISVAPQPRASTVYLSSPGHDVSFTVKTIVRGLNVNVIDAYLTTDDPENWVDDKPQFPVQFRPPSRSTDLNNPLTGVAHLHPALWPSVVASIDSPRSDKAQRTLYIYIAYAVDDGGFRRSLDPIPIELRFRPPFWLLLLCAAFGAVLGSICTLFIPASWRAKTAARTVGLAVVLAVITEILAWVLFQNDGSSLAIYGFSLNPTEILPASGLGIIAGLVGLKTLDAFKIPLPPKGDQ